MDISPPISDRTTDKLLEIVTSPEGWRAEVVEQAQQELVKRGIPIQEQKLKRSIKAKYKKRIATIKAKASYSKNEEILIVLLGPILVLFLSDLFLFQSSEEYKTKNKQGLICLLLGFGLWFIIIYILYLANK